MAPMKTTKKRKASPDLTESDSDNSPRKRKATARKSTGGASVGRRLPASTSAGPSTRRASGTQSGWGGGGRGDGESGSKSSALRGRMHLMDFAIFGWGFVQVKPLDRRKREGSGLGLLLSARSESTNGAQTFSFESSRFHGSYVFQPQPCLPGSDS